MGLSSSERRKQRGAARPSGLACRGPDGSGVLLSGLARVVPPLAILPEVRSLRVQDTQTVAGLGQGAAGGQALEQRMAAAEHVRGQLSREPVLGCSR